MEKRGSHNHAVADISDAGTVGKALMYAQTQAEAQTATGSGGAAWGGITGTLADQTDLQSALNAKSGTGHNHDAAYEAAGAVAVHEASADPHPGYLTTAEGDARYAASDHTHPGGSEAFPVGAVFIAVVSTNPGTLLGYGTWSAFGAGRVLVGLDAGQTEFDTVEETGGSKTVTLTAAQSGLPQHTHVQDAHTHTQNSHNHTQDAHSHTYSSQTATSGGASSYEHGAIDTSSAATESSISVNATTATNQAATAVNQNATATNQNAGPSDAAQAHTNLQPYIVVYMWKRTA